MSMIVNPFTSAAAGAAPAWLTALFAGGYKGFAVDFSDPSSVFSDQAMTTPATSGGVLRAVKDLSGNGAHLTTSYSGNTWGDTYANMVGANNSAFQNASSFAITSADGWTMIASFRIANAASPSQQAPLGFDYGSSTARIAQFYVDNGVATSLRLYSGSSFQAISGGEAPSGADAVMSAYSTGSGATHKLRLNGIEVASGSSSGVNTSASHMAIGGDWLGTTAPNFYPMTGRIYRALVINRQLTSAELAAVEAWASVAQSYDEVLFMMNPAAANGSTSFTDLSRYRRKLTVNGAAQHSTAQTKFTSSSLYFGTSDSQVDSITAAHDNALALAGSGTIGVWVYPTSFASKRFILSRRVVATNSTRTWWLDTDTTGKVEFVVSDDVSAATVLVSTASLTLNAWSYIQINVDSLRSKISMSINGVMQTNTITNLPVATTNDSLLYIGSSSLESGNRDWNGYIGPIVITSRVRVHSLPTDVMSVPAGDSWRSQTSLLVSCEGSNGSTTFTDQSPTPATITAEGGAAITTANAAGGAVSLNGSTKDLVTNRNAVIGSGAFTLEAYIRPTSAVTGRILSAQSPSSVNEVLALRTDSDGKLTCILRNTAGTVLTLQSAASQIVMNGTVEYHLSVTRDASGVVTLWLDGVSKASATATQSPDGGRPWYIGSFGNNQEFFAGEIRWARVTLACRYTAAFVPPPPPLPTT